MPTAVFIESVLQSIAITLGEELKDVAASFVPDVHLKSIDSFTTNSFMGIVNVVIIV